MSELPLRYYILDCIPLERATEDQIEASRKFSAPNLPQGVVPIIVSMWAEYPSFWRSLSDLSPFASVVTPNHHQSAMEMYAGPDGLLFGQKYIHTDIFSGIPQGHTIANGLFESWFLWNESGDGLSKEGFRQGWEEDHKSEWRVEMYRDDDVPSLEQISSFCPTCFHYAVGECSDPDHVHCSNCDTLHEVVE